MVHDVNCSRGNYDHIVVGPAGVFLLETKNLQARRVHAKRAAVPCADDWIPRPNALRVDPDRRRWEPRRTSARSSSDEPVSALGRTPWSCSGRTSSRGSMGTAGARLHPRLCVLQGNGSRRAPARSMRRQPTSWSQLYARSRLTDAAAANAWRDPRLCSPPQWRWKGGSARSEASPRAGSTPGYPRNRHPLPAGAGETRHVRVYLS